MVQADHSPGGLTPLITIKPNIPIAHQGQQPKWPSREGSLSKAGGRLVLPTLKSVKSVP